MLFTVQNVYVRISDAVKLQQMKKKRKKRPKASETNGCIDFHFNSVIHYKEYDAYVRICDAMKLRQTNKQKTSES